MEKHLLVTVSEQRKHLYADRFVAHFFTNRKNLKITLYYAAPRPPAVWAGERTLDGDTQREAQLRENELKGRKALEGAKRLLLQRGFAEESIKTKLQVRRFSKVMDIVQEGEDGLYDAVVLGRRGLSWLEQAFDESVTKELLSKKVGFPIWVCRKPDLDRRHALVCVDGSEASVRVADHVGFMLADQDDQKVTLMTVAKKGAREEDDIASYFDTCRKQMEANGFSGDRIKTKVVEAGNIAKAILKEAEAGCFGVVATGRTGKGEGLFMGSVSTTLFKELEKAGLWICY
ncbi:MAG: universal stress protein [Deltaproteobacteria bacterium]|nr:universal stress protein [Deltaproteobacteria bacterium]MBW1816001.1 universal stress protein [Deltaproteobacteria bacterium]MBW2283635.1 universal stress protein [Deltaproteobacteria bacterium]